MGDVQDQLFIDVQRVLAEWCAAFMEYATEDDQDVLTRVNNEVAHIRQKAQKGASVQSQAEGTKP